MKIRNSARVKVQIKIACTFHLQWNLTNWSSELLTVTLLACIVYFAHSKFWAASLQLYTWVQQIILIEYIVYDNSYVVADVCKFHCMLYALWHTRSRPGTVISVSCSFVSRTEMIYWTSRTELYYCMYCVGINCHAPNCDYHYMVSLCLSRPLSIWQS